MEEILLNWRFLNEKRFTKLAKDSNTVHHAAQFLTYAARSFIAEEPDDSHTSMYWNPDKNMLVGRTISTENKNIRLALNYPGLELMVAEDGPEPVTWKAFEGNTHAQMMDWLMQELQKLGLDIGGFSSSLHYEMPEHDTSEGQPFVILKDTSLNELATYRTNGHMLLSFFAGRYPEASEPLVWPHHFDEGVNMPVKHNNGEVTHSIGFGLAVPDNYYDNPYFYVKIQAKDGMEYGQLPEIMKPGRWHKRDWTGQVLEGKALTRMRGEEQAETAFHFLDQAITNALDMINS